MATKPYPKMEEKSTVAKLKIFDTRQDPSKLPY